jgi:hypothetical protein
MRHSTVLILHAREELTTSAHDALRLLKHDTSRPEEDGPGKRSGLAAVSQQNRSTAWSLTRRLKHSGAGRASTWYVRQNMSSERPVCYFGSDMRSK